MTIKVINLETKAVYIHRNVNNNDVAWIKLNPNLKIEFLKRRN